VTTGVRTDLAECERLGVELRRVEARANSLAEQAALRRVATAIVADTSPSKIYDLAAKEIALYLGVDLGVVSLQRRMPSDRRSVIGRAAHRGSCLATRWVWRTRRSVTPPSRRASTTPSWRLLQASFVRAWPPRS
jgi:GAF domain-containing protein